MSAPRFFCPVPLDRSIVGREIALPDALARHAVRVLRLREGDALTLFDGRGGEFAATLAGVDRRSVQAQIVAHDPVERESPLATTLVQAVIASAAMEIAIRKAVELGAAEIVPVVVARSQGAANDERGERRHAHWRQIAIAACEQCGRNRIPRVAPAIRFVQWLQGYDAADGAAALLGPGAARSLAAYAVGGAPRFVLVGPEGGWTAEEVAEAVAKGVAAVHLGPRVLRAETAGLVALATLNAIAGDAA